ncbi:Oxidoreductase molybdopterin binding domain-containing protein [Soonwooa buanensis]|uniref:Oxidoreductase molybdopterin binding domain-containing protein n=1 Tax=Soonwooa buanensis TaxID=619805 RepID=A0A1T5CNH7_9FLAO|nr:molybdopterin-dependent oxidoreductase [Soonwooa buanensis]SKB61065.1 Oxidoreductase molybdopterin binding domain-containing protein [Soonwooa buanensis]
MKKSIFLFLFLCSIIFVSAQNKFELKIKGEVKTPYSITLADLAKMPQATAVLNDKDGKVHTYSGVQLSELLAKADAPAGKEIHGENLLKYLLVKSADNYEVVFSLAEIDSSLNDKKIILADKMDGKALDAKKGPLRLVVEGEKRPARSSFQVTELVVTSAKE